MHRLERTTRVRHHRDRRRGGGIVKEVTEHYLRDDIVCHYLLCPICYPAGDAARPHGGGPMLPVFDASSQQQHWVMPDVQACLQYAELFELPEITGVICLQTCMRVLAAQKNPRPLYRLRDMLRDVRQDSVAFSNEHNRETWTGRAVGESRDAHHARVVLAAANWYASHLPDLDVEIVVVAASAAVADLSRQSPPASPRIVVLSPEEYVARFWGTTPSVTGILESLRSAQERQEADPLGSGATNKHGYSAYEPDDALVSACKSGLYLRGQLRVNKHHSQTEAFVSAVSKDSSGGDSRQEVYIPGPGLRNRAIHGDSVAVRLLPEAEWKCPTRRLRTAAATGGAQSQGTPVPTGQVVGVFARSWRDYVVTIQETDVAKTASKVLGIPMDRRVPKIRFFCPQKSLQAGHRLVVRVDDWELDSMWPAGHLVRDLGEANKVDTETAAILTELALSCPPFAQRQLEELPTDTPAQPWQPSAAEVEARRDVRATHLICSIDPLGCEDVDDALCCRRLDNGNIELSVHIADVTHFVRPGMVTDLEARNRSTTVYLADRRYDMLPEVLSANLCSLLDNVDRYAMSVFWELTPEYDVVSTWFGRTLIRSAYKLHYELAQELCDGLSQAEGLRRVPNLARLPRAQAIKRLEELRAAVILLTETARGIKRKRVGAGALELESAEVRVRLDDKHKTVQDLLPKVGLEVHEVVAECMIFANSSVAQRIASVFPLCALLRHHPLPKQDHFAELKRMAAFRGFEIDTSSNFSLARSLDDCQDPTDPNFNSIMRILTTQAMSEAAYFSTGSVDAANWFHYGLGLGYYTHFTSPIRRYADVVVHRLLMASLEAVPNGQLDPSAGAVARPMTSGELQEIADHINEKNRASKIAQRESLHLFQTLYFHDRESDPRARMADGIILKMRANGFVCYLPRFGFKAAVYLEDKQGQAVLPQGVINPSSAFGEAMELRPCPSLSYDAERETITVRLSPGEGRREEVVFSLFEHVQVVVEVEPSPYRLPEFRLSLVRLLGRDGGAGGGDGRKSLVRDVVSARKELDTTALLDDRPRLQKAYAQSEGGIHSLVEALQIASCLLPDAATGKRGASQA